MSRPGLFKVLRELQHEPARLFDVFHDIPLEPRRLHFITAERALEIERHLAEVQPRARSGFIVRLMLSQSPSGPPGCNSATTGGRIVICSHCARRGILSASSCAESVTGIVKRRWKLEA